MFTVIQDTKEKFGWDFEFYSDCKEVVRQGLREGDYTLRELLDIEEKTGRKILRIERKASTGEISLNLGQKWDTFSNELVRLQPYEHKAIIFEFSLDTLMQFPHGSGIPKRLWYRKNKEGKMVRNVRMNGSFMYARIQEIETQFNIPVIFTNNKREAMDVAVELFRQVFNANQETI